jgi:membrane-associated phospholipid phosphatase
MPSLHVAYALVVAWALFLAERRLVVRLLAVLYPFVMAAVVVISGNHWLLDVVGAFVTVAASWLVLLALTRGSSRLQTAVQSRLLRRAEVTSTFRASAVK